MAIQDRLCRIIRRSNGDIVASDAVGRVHLLDAELRPLRSSPVNRSGIPFYALLCTSDWIVGRDKLGNVARWDAETLEMTHWIETAASADVGSLWVDEEPSLTISRGIVELDGVVYMNNGFMQLLLIDLETFQVLEIRQSPTGDVPIEWICVDHPTIHAVTDKMGNLRLGDLRTNDFPICLNLDEKSNLHRVRYDELHDRFWVIQDEGSGETALVSNGVVTVRTDGTVDQEQRFALDDIECLEISQSGDRVYAAGFDGVIEEFDNAEPLLRRSRTLGAFSHQVSDLALNGDDSIYVLCQNGALTHVALDGTVLDNLAFQPQCFWDVVPDISDPDGDHLLAATDFGVARLRVAGGAVGPPQIEVADTFQTDIGFSRRVVSFEDGGWAVIGRDGTTVRCDSAGSEVWRRRVGGLLHTLSRSPDDEALLVTANSGAWELAASDGSVLGHFTIGSSPIWAGCYLNDGRLVISARAGVSDVLSPRRGSGRSVVSGFDVGDYPKRIQQHDDNTVVVTGGGGVRRIDTRSGQVVDHYHEALSNTAENFVFLGGFVYAVTYDSQIGVFSTGDGELLGVIEGQLPDFPKALRVVQAVSGQDYLLVGGRGGYLTTFALRKDGTPEKASTSWVRGANGPARTRFDALTND